MGADPSCSRARSRNLHTQPATEAKAASSRRSPKAAPQPEGRSLPLAGLALESRPHFIGHTSGFLSSSMPQFPLRPYLLSSSDAPIARGVDGLAARLGLILSPSVPIFAQSRPVIRQTTPVTGAKSAVPARPAPVVPRLTHLIAQSAPVAGRPSFLAAQSAPVVGGPSSLLRQKGSFLGQKTSFVGQKNPFASPSRCRIATCEAMPGNSLSPA